MYFYYIYIYISVIVECNSKSHDQVVECCPAGFLGLGEWQPYCKALETFLRQVASHSMLEKNKAVEIFLTSTDVSGHK